MEGGSGEDLTKKNILLKIISTREGHYILCHRHTRMHTLFFHITLDVSVCMWHCVCVDSLHIKWATRFHFVEIVNALF